MINPKELRIGNYVHKIDAAIYDSKIEYSNRLHVISHNDIYHIVEDGDPTNHPIPLTPEWMEQCGFNIRPGNRFYIFHNERVLFEYWLHDGSVVIEGAFFGGKIQHLHQLQNLYFALTGEELTIKL